MLIKIAINNQSKKGQNYKDDHVSKDVDDPTKGIVLDGNCCSCIERCSAHVLLKCCICDESYHNCCVKRPLSNEVTEEMNENPYCWWVCWSCTLTMPVDNDKDSQLNKVVSQLENIKESIITDISNLLNSKLSSSHLEVCRTEEIPHKRKRVSDAEFDTVFQNTPKQRKTVPDNVLGNLDPILPNVDQFIEHGRNSAHNAHNSAPASDIMSLQSNNHLARSFNQNRVEINADNNSAQKKFILHYKPISDACAFKSQDEWAAVRKNVSKKLNNIKMTFSNFNPKNGRVKLGFPTEDLMNRAKTLLDDSEEGLWCYENYTPALLLPKITVYNVPLDFEIPPDFSSNTTGIDFRDAVKTQLLESILDKNETVRFLVEKGSTIEVIYVQKHKTSCTVALKVSPELRHHIINSCNSKIYVFSARCRVADRYFYKQCFHCQCFGHVSSDCPGKNDPPVCMYCTVLAVIYQDLAMSKETLLDISVPTV